MVHRGTLVLIDFKLVSNREHLNIGRLTPHQIWGPNYQVPCDEAGPSYVDPLAALFAEDDAHVGELGGLRLVVCPTSDRHLAILQCPTAPPVLLVVLDERLVGFVFNGLKVWSWAGSAWQQY